MQLEISLSATANDTYVATDLGYLLHKNPERVFSRSVSAGTATVFYSQISDQRCTAVLHLNVDPIALVRGKNKHHSGLLDQYVNDRPFVANSLLSVAINKCYAQSLSGKSKERQSLADTPLPLSLRVSPIACTDAAQLVPKLFDPLGYTWLLDASDTSSETKENSSTTSEASSTLEVSRGSTPGHGIHSLTLQTTDTLSAVLNHLYVLIPVMDNAKHWWVDENEIDTLLSKGGQWLAQHPHRELISRRALKHRRDLSDVMLDRLARLGGEQKNADDVQIVDDHGLSANPTDASVTTQPVRLHDQRLDRVAELLVQKNVNRVLDIGCGEGKLIKRLLKQPGFTEIVGIDPSLRTLKKANEAFYLDQAGEGLSERLKFQLGSLTYADRRLRGYDAATMVEVIEHVDAARLIALQRNLFGDARPSLVIITTPNADYNAMYETLSAGEYRHDDHRFEWSRIEFEQWCAQVAKDYHYRFEIEALGPENENYGAPSQLALFTADHASLGNNNDSDSAVVVA